MPVEHAVLTDPNLHEPKNASTAADKTILVADGTGFTAWQNIPFCGLEADKTAGSVAITGSDSALTRISGVITGATTPVTPVEFSGAGNSEITYTGTLVRTIHAVASVTVDVTSASNDKIEVWMQKFTNSTVTWASITGAVCRVNVAAADSVAVGVVQTIVNMNQDDRLVIAVENVDAARDVEVVAYSITAFGFPGT